MHVLKLHASALHDEARSLLIYGGDSDAIQTRRRELRAGSLALDALAQVEVETLDVVADATESLANTYQRAGEFDRACATYARADSLRRTANALRDALDRIRADERA
jgi:hypothetical protein